MSAPVVVDVLEHRAGVYFRLGAGTPGAEMVSVKLTSHATFACLTCLTADACPHARAARDYFEMYGSERPAQRAAA